MKPDSVIVRFREPTKSDSLKWQNGGETPWFRSFKAAWSFIRGCDAKHPLTGAFLSGDELTATVVRGRIEDSDIYYLDVFGKDEKNTRKTLYARLGRVKKT